MNDYNDSNIFLSLENLAPFCLRKKIPEKALLTLTVNHRNRTEKQIIPSKTTVNWLFNDI